MVLRDRAAPGAEEKPNSSTFGAAAAAPPPLGFWIMIFSPFLVGSGSIVSSSTLFWRRYSIASPRGVSVNSTLGIIIALSFALL